jgi:membrane-bound serine protease (ClpP class)
VPASVNSPIAAWSAVAVTMTVSASGADGSRLDALVRWLDDPRVAFLLLTLGTASVIVEIAHPGIVGTGIAGVTAILMGLWSLSLQPVNPVGLVLLVLAAGFYAAEVLAPATGVAAALGSIALLIGGLLLVDGPDGGVPVAVVAPTAIVLGAAVVLAGRVAQRVRGAPSTLTGPGRFVGRDLVVDRTDGVTGQAFCEGAWWRVRSAGPVLMPGMPARVVALDGLDLVVDPRPCLEVDQPPWKEAP